MGQLRERFGGVLMNLHAIVAGAVGAINPPIMCVLMVSTGYTIMADGTQVPSYQTYVDVPADVQALSYSDLMKMSGLNIQGTRRAVYLTGNFEGLNREARKGGDLLMMPSLPGFIGPTTWLVAFVSEWWQDWCKIIVTLQLNQ
jgi:hypothetical protein